MTIYVASVDGFGDRDDMALAKDKDQGRIRDNKDNERAKNYYSLLDATTQYGSAEDARNLSEIVQEMIENECYCYSNLLKSHVIWDVETLSEAVTEACIQLGLSDEEFSPSTYDQGCEIEIRLV